jgi:hypothetical protein
MCVERLAVGKTGLGSGTKWSSECPYKEDFYRMSFMLINDCKYTWSELVREGVFFVLGGVGRGRGFRSYWDVLSSVIERFTCFKL